MMALESPNQLARRCFPHVDEVFLLITITTSGYDQLAVGRERHRAESGVSAVTTQFLSGCHVKQTDRRSSALRKTFCGGQHFPIRRKSVWAYPAPLIVEEVKLLAAGHVPQVQFHYISNSQRPTSQHFSIRRKQQVHARQAARNRGPFELPDFFFFAHIPDMDDLFVKPCRRREMAI